METEKKPDPVEVKCSSCEGKIGEYIGPIGYNVPILSRYFVRNDKSRPKHGSSSAGTCPACKTGINELECTMHAIAQALAKRPLDGPVELTEITPEVEAVTTPANEAADDLSSDCHS